jgi:hypothetical protein
MLFRKLFDRRIVLRQPHSAQHVVRLGERDLVNGIL